VMIKNVLWHAIQARLQLTMSVSNPGSPLEQGPPGRAAGPAAS
jgi:hypothetical protein